MVSEAIIKNPQNFQDLGFFYKFKLQSKLDLHKPKINFKFVCFLVEIFKGINTDLNDMVSWE